MGLLEQIQIVARARKAAQEAREIKDIAKNEWEQQNSEMLATVSSTAAVVEIQEEILRELTLKAYNETGNKSPAVGVGIREVTKLTYDSKVAFEWGVDHKMAIKLDTSAFEKIAKASSLPFVQIHQEPQATIAGKLEIEDAT